MSKREKEKRDSLDALARIARATSGPMPAAKPPPAPARAPARPQPRPLPPPQPAVETDADRARKRRLKERQEKLAEEKALKDRRASELARGSNLEWRGGGFGDIPASIRRTGFDRQEPTVSQKIQDVLGDAREKEGRAKAKAKGKRVGGGR